MSLLKTWIDDSGNILTKEGYVDTYEPEEIKKMSQLETAFIDKKVTYDLLIRLDIELANLYPILQWEHSKTLGQVINNSRDRFLWFVRGSADDVYNISICVSIKDKKIAAIEMRKDSATNI